MPPRKELPVPHLLLVWGDDDFAVKRRARQVYDQWCAEVGGFDHEVLDGRVSNSSEALRALSRLREALQTLPFFGTGKVIWFRDCNFVGDERAATTQSVLDSLASLAQELKQFRWDNVRLLISAENVDRRRVFYKTLETIGSSEVFRALSVSDEEWAEKAEFFVRQELRSRAKEMTDEAMAELVAAVGPNLRQIANEIEKVSLFVGERTEIGVADVIQLVSRSKQSTAFALGEALGDRDLPRALQALDEELWTMKFDRDKSPIGLLFGLISKVRTLLLLKEIMRCGLLKPESNYPRFKQQLERLPADALPQEKRYNPKSIHPYVLFKSIPQTVSYTAEELVAAMGSLLRCNERLVTSALDEAVALQQTLVQIIQQTGVSIKDGAVARQ